MKAYAIIQKDNFRPVLHGKDGQWCYWTNLTPAQKQEFVNRFAWKRTDAAENALKNLRQEHPGFPLDLVVFDV